MGENSDVLTSYPRHAPPRVAPDPAAPARHLRGGVLQPGAGAAVVPAAARPELWQLVMVPVYTGEG